MTQATVGRPTLQERSSEPITAVSFVEAFVDYLRGLPELQPEQPRWFSAFPNFTTLILAGVPNAEDMAQHVKTIAPSLWSIVHVHWLTTNWSDLSAKTAEWPRFMGADVLILDGLSEALPKRTANPWAFSLLRYMIYYRQRFRLPILILDEKPSSVWPCQSSIADLLLDGCSRTILLCPDELEVGDVAPGD